jgi:serine/threonine protein kinase
MELIKGLTLHDLLRQEGSLSLEMTVSLLAPICFALSYAHGRGLVHRDIKPSNIIIDHHSDGTLVPKLVDFGIAQFRDHSGMRLTKTGEIFGTPLYMSPEQCKGQRVDHRSDIYSVGCVVYEALTGAPPFIGANLVETTSMHVNAQALPLSDAAMGKKFPAAIERAVLKALQKDAKDRYHSCDELGRDLLNVSAESNKADFISEMAETKTAAELAAQAAQSTKTLRAGKSDRTQKRLFFVGCGVIPLLALAVFAAVSMQHKVENSTTSTEQPKLPPSGFDASFGVVDDLPAAKDKADAQAGYCRSKPSDHIRRFHFPTRSIGTLIVSDEKHESSVTTEAIGLVSVRKEDFLEYRPVVSLISKHPKLLDGFASDDLTSLRFLANSDLSIIDSGSDFDNILKHAAQLRTLRKIDLACTDVSISGLRNFDIDDKPYLEEVKIGRTSVNPAELANFKFIHKVSTLGVEGLGQIKPVLAELRNDNRLLSLSVANDGVDDQDISMIATMKNLSDLDLSGNQAITKQGFRSLAQLKGLRYLDIHGTRLSKDNLDFLAKLPLQSIILPSEFWNPMDAHALYKAMNLKCEVRFQDRSGARKIKVLS